MFYTVSWIRADASRDPKPSLGKRELHEQTVRDTGATRKTLPVCKKTMSRNSLFRQKTTRLDNRPLHCLQNWLGWGDSLKWKDSLYWDKMKFKCVNTHNGEITPFPCHAFWKILMPYSRFSSKVKEKNIFRICRHGSSFHFQNLQIPNFRDGVFLKLFGVIWCLQNWR